MSNELPSHTQVPPTKILESEILSLHKILLIDTNCNKCIAHPLMLFTTTKKHLNAYFNKRLGSGDSKLFHIFAEF